MRSRLNWVLVCAAGLASGWGCSGKDGDALSERFETQPNQGGSAGGSSQTGSTAPGTSTGGSSAGGSEGGGAAPGLSGNGAASGESRATDAGLVAETPGEGLSDAGAEPPAEDPAAEPDAEAPAPPPPPPPPPPPAQDTVAFAEVFPLLVASCGNCHGANAPGNRPRFAQAGNEAASLTATQGMSRGELVSARIVARAVTDRDMPPACNGAAPGTGSCLDGAEGALLQAWAQDAQP